jgi:hypothetical protein
MVIFSFTISTNPIFGSPVFSINYYDGWSLQELPYGFLFTSPEKQLKYQVEIYPNEYVQSIFSTTDMYQILKNIFTRDESQGNIQITQQPKLERTNDLTSLSTSYNVGGYEKQILMRNSKYILEIHQRVGTSQYINKYNEQVMKMMQSIYVDASMLPEGQRLKAYNEQLIQDTLDIPVKAMKQFADTLHEDNMKWQEEQQKRQDDCYYHKLC